MSHKITVIGDGAWGTTLAIMLTENGHDVTLWSAFAEQAAETSAARENRRFLPGIHLPDSLCVTADEACIADAEVVLSTVPSPFLRQAWQRLRPHCPGGAGICSVTKGIEQRTLLRATQIIADVLGDAHGGPLAALSGPSIAPEVARRLPATVVVASSDAAFAELVQALINRPYFRVYRNTDLVGVEIAGASKNVIAIAAGILDGIGAGDNAKAALLTRGLAEITRLGVACGGAAETFAGLAGVGDLVTTCISPIGRNRSFGEAIGHGLSAQQAQAKVHGVVEGVTTTQSVLELAGRLGVDMPITQAVHDVLFAGKKPADAIADLMARPLKAEA